MPGAETDPRALVRKADALAASGDTRAAMTFYRAALRRGPGTGRPSPELAADLARAKEACDRYAGEYTAFVREHLAAAGLTDGRGGARVAEALDLMFGAKQVFHQQPRFFYFPGLPQIQFYEREDFAWARAVEEATAGVRDELLRMLKDDAAFAPYVEGDPNRPHMDYQGLLNNPAWGACYLWRHGAPVEENAARCPKTMAALAHAPVPRIERQTPIALFSLLKPHTRIPPHHGYFNTRLICHLPLIVPGHCRLRVGNAVRAWEEGKLLIFDDTMEHEAFNDSGETRVVLLFDIWRPELSAEERGLVTALFEAVNAFDGVERDWTA